MQTQTGQEMMQRKRERENKSFFLSGRSSQHVLRMYICNGNIKSRGRYLFVCLRRFFSPEKKLPRSTTPFYFFFFVRHKEKSAYFSFEWVETGETTTKKRKTKEQKRTTTVQTAAKAIKQGCRCNNNNDDDDRGYISRLRFVCCRLIRTCHAGAS